MAAIRRGVLLAAAGVARGTVTPRRADGRRFQRYWSEAEEAALLLWARLGVPRAEMAALLDREPGAVRIKLCRLKRAQAVRERDAA